MLICLSIGGLSVAVAWAHDPALINVILISLGTGMKEILFAFVSCNLCNAVVVKNGFTDSSAGYLVVSVALALSLFPSLVSFLTSLVGKGCCVF